MNGPCTLYVIGVPSDWNFTGLRTLFSRCGKVIGGSVLPQKAAYNSKAGFIEYGKKMEGLKAIELFENYKIGPHTLRVSFAKKTKNEAPEPLGNATKIDLSSIVERNIERTTKRAAERFKRSDFAIEKPGFPCAICSKICQAACMSCKSVHYCGASCQKKDWPRHKGECEKLQKQYKNISEENFDVEVEDSLISQLTSKMKSCMDVKSSDLLSSSHPEVPFPVKADSTLQAQLLDLSSSGVIYCMVPIEEKHSSKLDSLHEYYSNGNGETPSSVEAGCYYACLFSGDKQWYRAFVLSISEDGLTSSVWYIDFGNCEDTATSNIRILLDEFASVPMRTIRCKLHGCENVSSSHIRDFLTQALSDDVVEIEVMKIHEGITYVKMYGLADGKLSLINDLVIENADTATQDPPVSVTSEVLPVIKEETMKVKQAIQEKTPSRSTASSVSTLSDASPVSPGLVSIQTSAVITSIGGGDGVSDGESLASVIGDSTSKKVPSKLQSVFNKIRTKAFEKKPIMRLQPLIIPKGKIQAVITHVEGVEKLHLSPVSDQEYLEILQRDLKTLCNQNFNVQPYEKGTLCVYFDKSSGNCKRAKMLSQEEEAVTVFFVDSGHQETVASSKLGKLPIEEKFWVCQKSIPCKLTGCRAGTPKFNTECVNLLKECEDEPVSVEINEMMDGTCPVTIYMEDSLTVNWCINELKEDFESEKAIVLDTKVNGDDNYHEESLPSEEISNSTNEVAKPVSMQICETSPSKLTTTVEINPCSPSVGVIVDVLVVHVVSPSEFYCQVITDELRDVLIRLSELNQGAVELDRQENFDIGQNCIACASDSQLYRAKITADHKNGSCTVLFVDYGNCEDVAYSQVRRLPPDLSKLNSQAVRCALNDCYPVNEDWSQECVNVVKSLIEQQGKAMFTCGREEDHYKMDLYLDDGVAVSNILIEQSLARGGSDEVACANRNVKSIESPKSSTEAISPRSLINEGLHQLDDVFEVKLSMVKPPVKGEPWMAEFAEMMMQFTEKSLSARVVKEGSGQSGYWTLVIPNLPEQLVKE